MKRVVKAILRAIWRLTSPLRRPLVRKFDLHVTRLIEEGARGTVYQIGGWVQGMHHKADHLSQEVDLVLNSLVREVARLEMQVEALRHVVQGRANARNGLSLVDVAGEEHDVESQYPEEQMNAVG